MNTDTIPIIDADAGAAWPDVGRAVPRHVAVAAHLTALTVLPSGVWRVVLGCGVTLGFARADLEADGIPGRGTVMVVCLTVLTEALALLTLGLVKPWGEVVPRWVPGLRGRRVPPVAAVVPAAIGGILLTMIWAFALSGVLTGRLDEITGTGWRVLMIACYLPTLLWGPLLLWVTWQYHWRRRG
jgi:hypothetical protein